MRRRARDTAGSRKMQTFLLRALRWLADRPWQKKAGTSESNLARFAAASLDRLHRKAVKEAHDIDWGDAAHRHLVRIRIKRLRYACDFFAASFIGALAKPYLKRLAALQDILGDLNDIAVHEKRFSAMGAQSQRSNPSRVFAAGLLTGREDARMDAAMTKVTDAYADLAKVKPFWR